MTHNLTQKPKTKKKKPHSFKCVGLWVDDDFGEWRHMFSTCVQQPAHNAADLQQEIHFGYLQERDSFLEKPLALILLIYAHLTEKLQENEEIKTGFSTKYHSTRRDQLHETDSSTDDKRLAGGPLNRPSPGD